jgi:hypothetical protein
MVVATATVQLLHTVRVSVVFGLEQLELGE